MSSLDGQSALNATANMNIAPSDEVASTVGLMDADNAILSETDWTQLESYRVEPSIPDYLKETYTWAYLRPSSVRMLDRSFVVNTILWGNYPRLLRAALAELRPGQKVYQPACVYGGFSQSVAQFLGSKGHLTVGDVAPVQVENCKRKTHDVPNIRVMLHDAADKCNAAFDVACCFFLLHEIPDAYKRRVVDTLLDSIEPGGKVVFVDYHGPHRLHPLKGVMTFINNALEPFAKALWINEIKSYASDPDKYTWTKKTYFGGLYQRVVAEPR